MADGDGVNWATASMATPATVDDLASRGFASDGLADADANALLLAVQADGDEAADDAVERGRAALFAQASRPGEEPRGARPGTIGEAAAGMPEANVAVGSGAGPDPALAGPFALDARPRVPVLHDHVPLGQGGGLEGGGTPVG